MPATFWDTATRENICQRISRLTPDSKAQWGKFSAAQMVAHLNDSMRMASGELTVAPKNVPLRYFPIKQLIIYALPFPKSAPTAPELIARCDKADLTAELAEFRKNAARLATKSESDAWPAHPAFGTLSRKEWGVLTAKHANHHLKQFGV